MSDAAGRHLLKSFSGYKTALSYRPTQLNWKWNSEFNCVEFFRQNCDTGLPYVQMRVLSRVCCMVLDLVQ
jgi:hypothetical protein